MKMKRKIEKQVLNNKSTRQSTIPGYVNEVRQNLMRTRKR